MSDTCKCRCRGCRVHHDDYAPALPFRQGGDIGTGACSLCRETHTPNQMDARGYLWVGDTWPLVVVVAPGRMKGYMGRAHSWSQYASAMSVRVKFPREVESAPYEPGKGNAGQVRDTFAPCELVVLVPR